MAKIGERQFLLKNFSIGVTPGAEGKSSGSKKILEQLCSSKMMMISGNTISCFRNCIVPYHFGCSRWLSKAGDRMSHKGKIRSLRLA